MVDSYKKSLNRASTIADACAQLDAGGSQLLFMCDEQEQIVGVVSDFEVRKFILSGQSLDQSVKPVVRRLDDLAADGQLQTNLLKQQLLLLSRAEKSLLQESASRMLRRLDESCFEKSEEHALEQLTVVKPAEERPNLVVLMVGGAGTRLRPLTDNCPKPLLPVNGKPLLERTIEQLSSYGFRRFCFAVGYMADSIMNYFGDGQRWGVHIDYVREEQRLGTCGALRLLPIAPKETILVMNGDLITGVKYDNLMNYHALSGASATLCVSGYDVPVPYGVVECVGNTMSALREKPINKYWISAGIYLLEPQTIDFIPPGGQEYDMPSLLQSISWNLGDVAVYPIRERWIDIGCVEEYERANRELVDEPRYADSQVVVARPYTLPTTVDGLPSLTLDGTASGAERDAAPCTEDFGSAIEQGVHRCS